MLLFQQAMGIRKVLRATEKCGQLPQEEIQFLSEICHILPIPPKAILELNKLSLQKI